MTAPVSNANSLASMNLLLCLDKTSVNLREIRQARGDINEIRMILKGNVEACYSLFRQAVKEEDVISQIQLSHVLCGIKWGKDSEKDFSYLAAKDLELFSYYPKGFEIFNSAYDEAMGIKSDWNTRQARSFETFNQAASQGYLPAFLELKCKEWKSNEESYGFAIQLRPFVGKGDKILDYYFGQALKRGCQVGSKLYYEGLYWMNQSLGIPVKYPKDYESFEKFKKKCIYSGFVFDDFISGNEEFETYYMYDDYQHNNIAIVLAPSEEAWKAFVKDKLDNVIISPIGSYLFNFNPEEIKTILNEHQIHTAVHNGSFVESSLEFPEEFFFIDSLVIYQAGKKIGEISVREGSFEIYQTLENPKIKPIIEFVENVMMRSGSPLSAHLWLRQIKGENIFY